jgi:hypothetical protein
MKRRVLTAMAGWLVVATVAFALVIAALGVSGAGPFAAGGRPISEADAAAELAQLSTAPEPPAAPTDGITPNGKLVVTDNGTARLDCTKNIPTIEYVSPAPGHSYSVKPTGLPGHELVILISGSPNSAQISATCVQGQLNTTVDQ